MSVEVESEVLFLEWFSIFIRDKEVVFAVFGGVSWAYVVYPEFHAFAVVAVHVLFGRCDDSGAVVFLRFGYVDSTVFKVDVFEFEYCGFTGVAESYHEGCEE